MDAFSEIRLRHEAGGVLPGLAYRDPAVFEAEVSQMFRTGWVSVTCGQNVPKPGDLFPIRIGEQSLFVARDSEGRIQVYYNLCRHRGMRLVDEPCQARGGKIACPYHGWTYGIDGRLKSAPYLRRKEENAPLDPAESSRLGLLSVRSATWRDIVFVNLSGDAKPFEDFLDVYHLPVLHSQVGMSFKDVLATEDIEVSEDIVGIVMSYGEESGVADWPLPRFPGLDKDQSTGLEIFSIFPNTLLIVEPDCSQVIVLRPQSAGLTTETFADYVVSDASQAESMADERAELHRASLKVNDQDAALLAGLQQTRSMDVGGDTQPSEDWDTTPQRFQHMWARKLLADR